MAKSPRTGENRGRRAAERRRVAAEPVTPETAPSTSDDYSGSAGASAGAGQDRVAMRETIARRAYEIYTARGGTDGYDIDDWLLAERELIGT